MGYRALGMTRSVVRRALGGALLVLSAAFALAGPACDTATAVALASEAGADDAAPAPKVVVLVADDPSHGRREHEYHAGVTLLASLLAQSPGVTAVVHRSFPDDPRALDRADTVVLMTSGRERHPLLAPARADTLGAAMARGAGLVSLHWSVDVTPALEEQTRAWLGGYALFGASVYPIWDATFEPLPDHPVARGLPATFSLHDELYFGLRFAGDLPRLAPILRARPPDDARTTPETAAALGRTETVAWAYDRAGGGRSFGYSGLHFHDTWSRYEVRRLVVNAILWTAGREVPRAGAPVELDPAILERDLDPK